MSGAKPALFLGLAIIGRLGSDDLSLFRDPLSFSLLDFSGMEGKVHFDPGKITYDTVLDIFFAYHDPTTLNRQGADVGTSYRSVILYHDSEQERVARETVARLDASGTWPNPIVTEIAPLDVFYVAEVYHQSFYTNNPDQPYCQFVIDPKVKKLREKHASLLKASA